jgi:hypothetical protein
MTLLVFVVNEKELTLYRALSHGSHYKPRIGGKYFVCLRIHEAFLIPWNPEVVNMIIVTGVLILWGICTTDWKTAVQAAVYITTAAAQWSKVRIARAERNHGGQEQREPLKIDSSIQMIDN